jgi:SAM-dependent methyltransferase
MPTPDAALNAVRRWLLDDSLPALPPEHQALADLPFGLRLDLRRLNDPWRTLRLSQHTAVGLGTWATWDADPPGHAFAPPGTAWAMAPDLHALMTHLRGDEIELHYALAGRVPLLPRGTWIHPDGWWDDWKSRPVDDDGGTLGQIYRERLYPWALAALPPGPLAVVDVCGGDGELAALVADAHPGGRVTVLERNRAAGDAARARGLPVIHADAADPAGWSTLHDLDAVLLIGAVQGNVLTPDAALAVLRHAHAALRPGGLIVITGWSPCLVDSDDLRRLGFDVFHTAVPPTDTDPNPRQLYLARRA